jgi:hypothetical protein
MKVKAVTFFYNTHLLSDICNEKRCVAKVKSDFSNELKGGDIVKFIGNDKSCIVKILAKSSPDINRYCELMFDLIKVVKGELEIEYDI